MYFIGQSLRMTGSLHIISRQVLNKLGVLAYCFSVMIPHCSARRWAVFSRPVALILYMYNDGT